MPIQEKKAKLPTPEDSARLQWLRPYIRQAGDDLRPPWSLGRRRLLDFLAVYIDRGEGTFSLGEDEFPVGPGTLFWVPPDTPHAMCGTGAEMHCLYCHFDLLYDPRRSHWDAFVLQGTEEFGERRERLHPPLPPGEIAGWRGVLPLRSNRLAILHTFREICRRFHGADAYSPACSGLLIVLVEEIRRGLRETEEDTPERRIIAARDYLRAHFARPGLSIAALARRFGFSEAHFRVRFREYTGASPREYLRLCKLEYARELLAYTDLTVGQVAGKAGFSSIYDFSRCFRRCFHLPPGTLRKGGAPIQ